MAVSWRTLFTRSAPASPKGLQTKGLEIINDGFIPREVITLSETVGRGHAPPSEGLDANVVMAPVSWIMRTFPDAVARVKRNDGDKWDWVDRHQVQRLIRRPNPWYNGDALWQATCLSYVLHGNAYWQKIRNAVGQVIQLWYRPHWCLRPHTPLDGSAFIDWYDYDTGRGIQRLNVRDVVHLRFSMRILENMGIPGVVVSPTVNPTGEGFEPNRSELEALKEYITTSFTGDNRGRPLAFGHPTQVTQFGFDPSKLTLTELRNAAEERVCAMLGLPVAVVGFKSGLEQTKVGATMDALVKLAWKQCLFPMQRGMARQLDEQLLSDFVPDYEDRERVEFDVSEAVSLQEDPDALSTRVCNEVSAGILRVDRAQEMLGHEVDPTQEVYLRPTTAMPYPPEAIAEPLALPQEAPADQMKGLAAVLERMGTVNGNGNGHPTNEE